MMFVFLSAPLESSYASNVSLSQAFPPCLEAPPGSPPRDVEKKRKKGIEGLVRFLRICLAAYVGFRVTQGEPILMGNGWG